MRQSRCFTVRSFSSSIHASICEIPRILLPAGPDYQGSPQWSDRFGPSLQPLQAHQL